MSAGGEVANRKWNYRIAISCPSKQIRERIYSPRIPKQLTVQFLKYVIS